MTDDDLLAGTIAGRLRLLPAVQQLYPPRRGAAGLVSSAVGLLAAVSEDPTVDIRTRRSGVVVEATVGVTAEPSALVTAAEVLAEIHAALPDTPGATVRLRIASIG